MSDEEVKIISPEVIEEDYEASYSLRPSTLAEFIGQKQSCSNLKVFVDAARQRGDSLDHVLFYGPPGLGKTTLAHIVSKEMQAGFTTTSGPLLTKAGDLAALLTNLQAGDILFIDEIHRLNPLIEEVLYPAMEDFSLDLIIGEGPAARTVKIDLQPFTLVGATTRLGLLTNPLRDRFGIHTRLMFYTPAELQLVIERGAGILNIGMTKKGSFEIARRSRGTPRIALRLLRRVRDFCMVKGDAEINDINADVALKCLEVDNFGLDGSDHRYIRFIAENYNGGPVGIETIAAGLSEQKDSIEETIEPYLIQQGFIQRTPRGRVLTQNALKHIEYGLHG